VLATVEIVETWERWREWGTSFQEEHDGGTGYVWGTSEVLVSIQERPGMVDFLTDLFQIWGMLQGWGWKYLGGIFLLLLYYFVQLSY